MAMMVRIVDSLVGTVTMRTHIAPRMGYGKDIPTLRSAGDRSGEPNYWIVADTLLALALAELRACPQPPVERLQQLGVDPGGLHRTEPWSGGAGCRE
jgi:hypothetical protein